MAKTNVMISCAVTAQLICVFFFTYAKIWFSHGAAHLYYMYFHEDLVIDMSRLVGKTNTVVSEQV